MLVVTPVEPRSSPSSSDVVLFSASMSAASVHETATTPNGEKKPRIAINADTLLKK
jgi:hypothetical protein